MAVLCKGLMGLLSTIRFTIISSLALLFTSNSEAPIYQSACSYKKQIVIFFIQANDIFNPGLATQIIYHTWPFLHVQNFTQAGIIQVNISQQLFFFGIPFRYPILGGESTGCCSCYQCL